ncbi:MAG: hypothetical protein IKN07_10965, partial [Lachnospiraceae bacterium]|nr:hypothetical protein [Lachnospiraceae bacterium]
IFQADGTDGVDIVHTKRYTHSSLLSALKSTLLFSRKPGILPSGYTFILTKNRRFYNDGFL